MSVKRNYSSYINNESLKKTESAKTEHGHLFRQFWFESNGVSAIGCNIGVALPKKNIHFYCKYLKTLLIWLLQFADYFSFTCLIHLLVFKSMNTSRQTEWLVAGQHVKKLTKEYWFLFVILFSAEHEEPQFQMDI